jgi:hypothetical protein
VQVTHFSVWNTILLLLQDGYDRTYRVLFKNPAVFVIVYDGMHDRPISDLHRHLMSVTSVCKDVPVVLVGTYGDGPWRRHPLPLNHLKTSYPMVWTINPRNEFRSPHPHTFLGWTWTSSPCVARGF